MSGHGAPDLSVAVHFVSCIRTVAHIMAYDSIKAPANYEQASWYGPGLYRSICPTSCIVRQGG